MSESFVAFLVGIVFGAWFGWRAGVGARRRLPVGPPPGAALAGAEAVARAAFAMNSEAQVALGIVLLAGSPPLPQNASEALRVVVVQARRVNAEMSRASGRG